MKKTSKTTPTFGKPSVVFFGSGPVAAKSLELLLHYCNIEAVVTKPATVKEMCAVQNDLCVYSVNNRSELDMLLSTKPFSAPLGILIDFGIIISKQVIEYFPKGIVNSHFSLLPQWRGADPITFSILSGQKKTGVSLMLVDEGMDTGKILVQKSLAIEADETTSGLTGKLIDLSDSLLQVNIPKYISGELRARQQPHPDRATYSRKLTKEDGVLDFTKPAQRLEREIRAFSGWPKSRTILAGKDVVVTKATAIAAADGKPGEVLVSNDRTISISTSEGGLLIERLKPAGKNEMAASAFLAGYGHLL